MGIVKETLSAELRRAGGAVVQVTLSMLASTLTLNSCNGKTVGGTGAPSESDSSASTTSGSSNTTSQNTSASSAGTSATSAGGSNSGTSTPSVTSTTAGVESHLIPFEDGWAPMERNTLGIQGAFYTFSDMYDGGTSFISQTFQGNEACAQGFVGRVELGPDGLPAYAIYWGAALGFNLYQEVGFDAAMPYDAAAHGVSGFAFVVKGPNPLPAGGELRFTVKVAGDPHAYCAKIPSVGDNAFHLRELHQDCWNFDVTAPTPDPTQLEALHWQYVTNLAQGYRFDLCIAELSALTDE